MCQLRETHANLVQKSYHNSHYRFYGLKVSAMLEVDGTSHIFLESSCMCNYMVLCKISMIEMIAQLNIGLNERVTK